MATKFPRGLCSALAFCQFTAILATGSIRINSTRDIFWMTKEISKPHPKAICPSELVRFFLRKHTFWNVLVSCESKLGVNYLSQARFRPCPCIICGKVKKSKTNKGGPNPLRTFAMIFPFKIWFRKCFWMIWNFKIFTLSNIVLYRQTSLQWRTFGENGSFPVFHESSPSLRVQNSWRPSCIVGEFHHWAGSCDKTFWMPGNTETLATNIGLHNAHTLHRFPVLSCSWLLTCFVYSLLWGLRFYIYPNGFLFCFCP